MGENRSAASSVAIPASLGGLAAHCLQKVVAQLPRTDFTEKQGKLGWGALESVEFSYLSFKSFIFLHHFLDV